MVDPFCLFLNLYFWYDQLLSWFGLVMFLKVIKKIKVTFSGVRALRNLPGDFLLIEESIFLKCSTDNSIDFLSWRASFWRNIKWARKALCVAITDSLVFKYVSTANSLCTPVQSWLIVFEINCKSFARWNSHYHSLRFTCRITLHILNDYMYGTSETI